MGLATSPKSLSKSFVLESSSLLNIPRILGGNLLFTLIISALIMQLEDLLLYTFIFTYPDSLVYFLRGLVILLNGLLSQAKPVLPVESPIQIELIHPFPHVLPVSIERYRDGSRQFLTKPESLHLCKQGKKNKRIYTIRPPP